MKRRRWRRGTCSFPRRAAANVAAPSLASCLIRMSRCRPLFGKQGAQRLIHIRQLLGSCTEPSAAPSPSAGRTGSAVRPGCPRRWFGRVRRSYE